MTRNMPTVVSLEEQREQVRRVAAQSSGEATSVVALDTRLVAYAVQGRRRDGTVRGHKTVRRLLRAIFIVPLLVLWAAIVLLLSVIFDGDFDVDLPSRRKITVRGSASCAALPFADAIRGSSGRFWIAWSRHQLALLVTVDGELEPRMLWSGRGPDRPKLKVSADTPSVRWSDESCVEFTVSKAEKTRIAETNGAP